MFEAFILSLSLAEGYALIAVIGFASGFIMSMIADRCI